MPDPKKTLPPPPVEEGKGDDSHGIDVADLEQFSAEQAEEARLIEASRQQQGNVLGSPAEVELNGETFKIPARNVKGTKKVLKKIRGKLQHSEIVSEQRTRIFTLLEEVGRLYQTNPEPDELVREIRDILVEKETPEPAPVSAPVVPVALSPIPAPLAPTPKRATSKSTKGHKVTSKIKGLEEMVATEQRRAEIAKVMEGDDLLKSIFLSEDPVAELQTRGLKISGLDKLQKFVDGILKDVGDRRRALEKKYKSNDNLTVAAVEQHDLEPNQMPEFSDVLKDKLQELIEKEQKTIEKAAVPRPNKPANFEARLSALQTQKELLGEDEFSSLPAIQHLVDMALGVDKKATTERHFKHWSKEDALAILIELGEQEILQKEGLLLVPRPASKAASIPSSPKTEPPKPAEPKEKKAPTETFDQVVDRLFEALKDEPKFRELIRIMQLLKTNPVTIRESEERGYLRAMRYFFGTDEIETVLKKIKKGGDKFLKGYVDPGHYSENWEIDPKMALRRLLKGIKGEITLDDAIAIVLVTVASLRQLKITAEPPMAPAPVAPAPSTPAPTPISTPSLPVIPDLDVKPAPTSSLPVIPDLDLPPVVLPVKPKTSADTTSTPPPVSTPAPDADTDKKTQSTDEKEQPKKTEFADRIEKYKAINEFIANKGFDVDSPEPAIVAIRWLLGVEIETKEALEDLNRFLMTGTFEDEIDIKFKGRDLDELKKDRKEKSKQSEVLTSRINSCNAQLSQIRRTGTGSTDPLAIEQRLAEYTAEKHDVTLELSDLDKGIERQTQRKTKKTIHYRHPTQLLGMINTYFAKQEVGMGVDPNYATILKETQEQLEDAREVEITRSNWVCNNLLPWSYLKPTLAGTLRAIVEKDDNLKKLKPEYAAQLAKVCDSPKGVAGWIKNLEGSKTKEGLKENMEQVIPSLIAHLSIATNEGKMSNINALSLGSALSLLKLLRRAVHEYSVSQAEATNGECLDRVSAYFTTMNTINNNTVARENVVTEHSRSRMWINLGKAAIAGTAGIGAIAMAGLGAPLLAGAAVAGIAAPLTYTSFRVEDPKTKAALRSASVRIAATGAIGGLAMASWSSITSGVLAGASAIGTAGGLVLAASPFLIPAVVAGMFAPEIKKIGLARFGWGAVGVGPGLLLMPFTGFSRWKKIFGLHKGPLTDK